MEELGCMDGLGAQPMLLLPIAHRVRIGRSILTTRGNEVVKRIVVMALRVAACPLIGRLLNRNQIARVVLIHLGIEVVVLRELPGILHKAVGDHEELELLVFGIGDAVRAIARERSGGLVDEADNGGPQRFHRGNSSDHLGSGSRHRRDDDNALVGDALVAQRVVLRRVLHHNGQVA